MTRAPVEVLELAVVDVIFVFPVAVRVVVVVFPEESVPVVTCPATPRPPEMVRAPVPVVVLTDVFEKVTSPVAVRDPVEMFPDVTCPDTPRPPVITTDPVPVVVLAVPLVNEEIPEKVGLLIVEIIPPVMVIFVPPVYMVVPTRTPLE